MTTPGASSGTTAFTLANDQVQMEAFDRIGLRPTQLDRHHLLSARISLNLELQAWSNRGINLWKMISGSIALVAGQATYSLPATLVSLTELYYTTVDLTGSGNSVDRMMTPMTRSEYVNQSMKSEPGTPMQFWFQRLQAPVVTLWQPPAFGAPGFVCNWWGLARIQDAGIGGGETPDIVYRALDALCAGLAKRLAEKFAPALFQAKKIEAAEAWGAFAANDQEDGPIIMRPNLSGYGRI